MLYAEYDPEVEMRVVRKEALEEGRDEEKLIIAKNLLAKGSSLEFVHEITGLNLEEIERLQ